MNIPKTIQEAVFLAVCNSKAGVGMNQPWDDEEHSLETFDSKGNFIRKGFVELPLSPGLKVEVPFVAVYKFGKPRRAKAVAAAKVSS